MHNIRIPLTSHARSKSSFEVVEAIKFFSFLRKVGSSHNVKVSYRKKTEVDFILVLSSDFESNIETFLLELMLKKGLFYYVCSLEKKSKKIIKYVLKPIFEILLEQTFEYIPNISLEEILSGIFVSFPSNTSYSYTKDFDLLFLKYNLKMIDDKEYVLSLDLLLSNFLLEENGHKIGEKSGNYYTYVDRAKKVSFNLDEKVIEAFKQIHEWRTYDLHRRKTQYTKLKLNEVSQVVKNYFGYYDDYYWSQQNETLTLKGKIYKKIKLGEEKGQYPDRLICGDCAVRNGEYHVWACDWEQCPRCLNQLLGCGCEMS